MTSTQPPPAPRRIAALISVVALLGVLAGPPAAKGAPPLLREFCAQGSGAGQCSIPVGIAVDPASGNAYVGDGVNRRVSEFDAWGTFLRTWGWDVVASGPGDDTTAPEDQLEVCVPAEGDVCKAGLEGAGSGQFGNLGAWGVAVDSAGDVYVVDAGNARVQKFDSSAGVGEEEVKFLLMIGGGVNKTKSEEGGSTEAERNLCTAAAGDVCQAGSEGTGNGQFGDPVVVDKPVTGDNVDVGPDGQTLYVGDKERVQEFDADGGYAGDLPDSGGVLAGNWVKSLAFDPAGSLYLIFKGGGLNEHKDNVLKLGVGGEELCSLKVKTPMALATDAAGNVYVGESIPTGFPKLALHQFTPACAEVPSFAFVLGENSAATESRGFGLATSSACGIAGTDLFVPNSVFNHSLIRLYGPPPDPDVCPPPQVPPTIADSYALSVDTSSATVRAEINPHFWPDTRYHVQYGTADCSLGGCQEQPVGSGALLTGETVDAAVPTTTVFLSGLQSDTTYHYRFVAQGSGGGPVFGPDRVLHTFPPNPEPNTGCPNQAFRTGLSASLSDCRAYEMVSPVDKNNGDIANGTTTEGGFRQASTGGERMTFSSLTAFAGAQSSTYFSQYLASRDAADGWLTHSISPPREPPSFFPAGSWANTFQFKAFSEDLCSGWLLNDTRTALAPGAPASVPNLYRRSNCDAEDYELLTTVPPPGFGFSQFSPYYVGAMGFSANGSRSVFDAPAALTPNACPAEDPYDERSPTEYPVQVYVSYDAGKLRLVSVLPNGQAACTHSSAGTAGGIADFKQDNVHHAVSEDGSRIFWTDTGSTSNSHGSSAGSGPGKLYVRINATELQSTTSGGKCIQPTRACTITLSEASTSRFWSADPSATTAIFTTGDIGASPGTAKLHLFDIDEEEGETIAEGVVGFMGASEDASRVYFVSTDVLPGGQNSEGEEAQAAQPNLYLYERGSGFGFIGTLASRDIANLAGTTFSPIAIKPYRRTSRVSLDGLHAAFTSTAPLTGSDITDVSSGQPDGEVYLYNATANGGEGKLICASCNPSGARPSGRPASQDVWVAAQVPTWRSQTHPGYALSAGGDRLFFESTDALILGDTNGKKDVYEWEAPGSGDCTQASRAYFAANGGCLSLISSGRSPSDSEFFDATPSGSDVFFVTDSSLLPQDPGLADVYDARVGGGFAPPPPPPPPCVGDACQSVPAPAEDPSPASARFRGAGDLKATVGCNAAAKRAAKLAREAKRARHTAQPGRAARLARSAKRLEKRAERCRARNRANRNRGGSR